MTYSYLYWQGSRVVVGHVGEAFAAEFEVRTVLVGASLAAFVVVLELHPRNSSPTRRMLPLLSRPATTKSPLRAD